MALYAGPASPPVGFDPARGEGSAQGPTTVLATHKRPRNLGWHHAGALLFGDWGTSRLYVLGLAFFYTAHATTLFLIAMSALMAGVAWAYTIICRNFPEGGGVYASARQISPLLSVVGATLLFCDYIVTASLSIIEAMHYLGVPGRFALGGAIGTIILVSAINWFGARSAGRFAIAIAVAALGASVVIALLAIPFFIRGLSETTLGHPTVSSAGDRWQSFVRIVLALSGVEAVANMTGVMREPVRRTAKRTIWPVLCEVVLLNLIFGVALSGLPRLVEIHQPDYFTYSQPEVVAAAKAQGVDPVPDDVRAYRDTAVKTLAKESAARQFGDRGGLVVASIVGVIFGLLLISAGSTAIMGMVGVQYAMAQDGELPRLATRLNYSGVPWVPLLIAVGAPIGVLLLTHDVAALADLYAVGVCGAITINVLCAAVNRRLDLKRWERAGVWIVGGVMLAVELTILITKPHATIFAGSIIAAAVATRFVVHLARGTKAAESLEPAHGWLAEILRPAPPVDMSRPRIMLAARGRNQSEFAVDLARRRAATLFAIYVRTLRVLDVAPGAAPRIEDDKQAQEALGATAMLAREAGVPCIPIYVCSESIADEVLDYTVTYGCDTLIVGKTGRRALARALEGDVTAKIAQHLPEGVTLIERDPDAPHEPAQREAGPPRA